jgi:hypothetical protein
MKHMMMMMMTAANEKHWYYGKNINSSVINSELYHLHQCMMLKAQSFRSMCKVCSIKSVLYVSTPSDETVIRLTIKQPQTGGYSSLWGGGGALLELGHFKKLHIPPKKFMSSK